MTVRILVPLDGSEFSEHALSYAAEIARHEDAALHLVTVHVPPAKTVPSDPIELGSAYEDEVKRQADRDYLDRMARDPRVADLAPATAMLQGPVVASLTAYVHICEVDLVVMSTHGRGGLKRAWLGSVADALLRAANVPMLLLRPRGNAFEWNPAPAAFHKILLPIDASQFSEGAIEAALALGGLEGVQYTLLHILQPPIAVAFGDGIPLSLQADAEQERLAAALHLAAVATRLRLQGYHATTALTTSPDVATGIRAYVAQNEIDLIAMVTQGRSGWKRIALGSIADRVIRKTSVPLLVLNPHTRSVAEKVSNLNGRAP